MKFTVKENRIIKNSGALSFDYVPDEAPHRDPEMQQLFDMLSPVITENFCSYAYINGTVGSGKTVISKIFMKEFSSFSLKEYNNSMLTFYVNCLQNRTPVKVLSQLLSDLGKKIPERGFSQEDFMSMFTTAVRQQRRPLIITLDEADSMVTATDDSLIFKLMRINEQIQDFPPMALILISLKHPLEILSQPVLSTLGRTKVIKLKKYSEEQLFDIIRYRASIALTPGSCPHEIISMIARDAAVMGDARYAMEILNNAAREAQVKGRTIILPEDVRVSTAKEDSFINLKKLEILSNTEKIILAGVARSLRNESMAVTGDCENCYLQICEEFDLKSVGSTQFWKSMKRLEAAGFIKMKQSGQGYRGTTMIVTMDHIPALALEETLLKNIKK